MESVNDQTIRLFRNEPSEGAVGECIMPNLEVYRRENDMYADIFGEENGTLHWSDPQSTYNDPAFNDLVFGRAFELRSWHICKAPEVFAARIREGLNIAARVWGSIDLLR